MELPACMALIFTRIPFTGTPSTGISFIGTASVVVAFGFGDVVRNCSLLDSGEDLEFLDLEQNFEITCEMWWR